MSRIVWWFAVVGAAIPIILQIIARISLFLEPMEIPAGRLLWPYLWPSYFILGGTANPDTSTLVIVVMFILSVLVNVLVYLLIGAILAFTWNTIVTK